MGFYESQSYFDFKKITKIEYDFEPQKDSLKVQIDDRCIKVNF